MLHPNPTAPYTVRNLLGSTEFYPSYEKAGQSDCLTQMSSIHGLAGKNGGNGNPSLHLQDSSNNYLYAGETTRPMYMKSDVPSHPNTTTSTIHEAHPQGKVYIK